MGTAEATDHLRVSDPLNAEWVTALLLGLFVLLALINAGSSRKWRLFGQAMFRMRLGKQAMREEFDLQERGFLSMLFLALCVISLFGWQYLHWRGLAQGLGFLPLLGLVAGAVLFQLLLLRAVAGLFRVDRGVAEHLYTGLLLFILAGLVLLPVAVLMAYRAEYRSYMAPLGLAVVGFMLLYRWVRGTWIGVGEGVPVRYIIVYFCAAEILPVLLAIGALRQALTGTLQP